MRIEWLDLLTRKERDALHKELDLKKAQAVVCARAKHQERLDTLRERLSTLRAELRQLEMFIENKVRAEEETVRTEVFAELEHFLRDRFGVSTGGIALHSFPKPIYTIPLFGKRREL